MDLEFLGDSFCVQAAGYQNNYLTVQFQDGSIYTYEGVSPQRYVAFKRSTSKGEYFNYNIRNNYSFFRGLPPDLGPASYIDQKFLDALPE